MKAERYPKDHIICRKDDLGDKINKIRNEIYDLEKLNKKMIKENGDKAKIDANNEKINKLKKKLRDLKKEKQQKLGGNYTDDTTVRPFIDI